MPIRTANQYYSNQVQKPNEYSEKVILTFEQALNNFKQALLQAYRQGNKSYAIAHASTIQEKIVSMRQEAPGMPSSKAIQDAELIEHLNNTAALLSADEDEIEKVQRYVASAKALYPINTVLKRPMLACASAGMILGTALMVTGISAYAGLVLVAASIPVAINGGVLFYKSWNQEEALLKSAKKLCQKDGPRVRVALVVNLAR